MHHLSEEWFDDLRHGRGYFYSVNNLDVKVKGELEVS